MRWSVKLKTLVLGSLLAFYTSVSAATPTEVLQGVADKMIAELSAHKTELKSDPKLVRQIVDNTLVPVIDANRMGGMVVGRQYWYGATPAERSAFLSLFQHLVINTYASALASYDDDKVKIDPLRDKEPGRIVSVQSTIIRKNGRRIGINYQMIRTQDTWKVFDFSVEGVSIVSNYRAQFSNTLASGGLKELVAQLKGRMSGSQKP